MKGYFEVAIFSYEDEKKPVSSIQFSISSLPFADAVFEKTIVRKGYKCVLSQYKWKGKKGKVKREIIREMHNVTDNELPF